MNKGATLAAYTTLALSTLSCTVGRFNQQDTNETTSSKGLRPRTTQIQPRVIDTVLVVPETSYHVLKSQAHKLQSIAAAHEGLADIIKTTHGETTLFSFSGSFPLTENEDRLETRLKTLLPKMDVDEDHLISPGELKNAIIGAYNTQEGLKLIKAVGYTTKREQVEDILRTLGFLTPEITTVTVRYQRNIKPKEHVAKLEELLPLIDTRKKDKFLDAKEVKKAITKAKEVYLRAIPKPVLRRVQQR